MVALDNLKVSITKNGYMKLAEVVKRHPRDEVLDNIRGTYVGINLIRSQISNIMDESVTGEVPEFWDDIRKFNEAAIESFVFVAVVFSHGSLINALKDSSVGDMRGYLQRSSFKTPKVYMNLQYAMSSIEACEYQRGSESINYDLRAAIFSLLDAGPIVAELIETKLRRCGWRPSRVGSQRSDFLSACEELEIPKVFGLTSSEFRRWMRGKLRIAAPITPGTIRIQRTK